MKKAILFDFDGVIVESITPRYKIVQKYARLEGVRLADELIHEIDGITTRDFLSRHIKDKATVERVFTKYKEEFQTNPLDHVVPIEHTISFITTYDGPLLLGVGTNGGRDYVRKVMDKLGITNKIKALVTRDDVSAPKPDPAVYLTCAEKLRVTPDECIVIDDTVVGAQAAFNAGMEVYINLHSVNKKSSFEQLPIKRFISSYDDLIRISNE